MLSNNYALLILLLSVVDHNKTQQKIKGSAVNKKFTS